MPILGKVIDEADEVGLFPELFFMFSGACKPFLSHSTDSSIGDTCYRFWQGIRFHWLAKNESFGIPVYQRFLARCVQSPTVTVYTDLQNQYKSMM